MKLGMSENNHNYKYLAILFLIVVATVFILSITADIPYIITLLGFSFLAFIGGIVGLGEYRPGEYDNPEGSKRIYKAAKIETMIRLLIFIGIFALIFYFPSLKQYGA